MNYSDKEREAYLRVIEDDTDPQIIINSLELMIEQELQKPDDLVDTQLIDECVEAILEIRGITVEPSECAMPSPANAPAAESFVPRRPGRWKRFITAACIALVVMTAGNTMVASAFDFNFFDEVVKLGQQFISFIMGESLEAERPSTDMEIYTILQDLCDSYEVAPLLPTWFPETMDVDSTNMDETSRRKVASFALIGNDSGKTTTIHIQYYFNIEDAGVLNTVEKEAGEMLICGDLTFYITKREKTYSAAFRDGQYVYNLSTQMSYEDMVRMLESFE